MNVTANFELFFLGVWLHIFSFSCNLECKRAWISSMSSLEQQLKQLGTADLRNVTENSRKYRSSYLFDAREAADQDLETIYSIGLNGIMELRILDPQFSAFESTLFSENMKSMDRVLQVCIWELVRYDKMLFDNPTIADLLSFWLTDKRRERQIGR